jgi:hypothetical protein
VIVILFQVLARVTLATPDVNPRCPPLCTPTKSRKFGLALLLLVYNRYNPKLEEVLSTAVTFVVG